MLPLFITFYHYESTSLPSTSTSIYFIYLIYFHLLHYKNHYHYYTYYSYSTQYKTTQHTKQTLIYIYIIYISIYILTTITLTLTLPLHHILATTIHTHIYILTPYTPPLLFSYINYTYLYLLLFF